jgi:hypothetical protein
MSTSSGMQSPVLSKRASDVHVADDSAGGTESDRLKSDDSGSAGGKTSSTRRAEGSTGSKGAHHSKGERKPSSSSILGCGWLLLLLVRRFRLFFSFFKPGAFERPALALPHPNPSLSPSLLARCERLRL